MSGKNGKVTEAPIISSGIREAVDEAERAKAALDEARSDLDLATTKYDDAKVAFRAVAEKVQEALGFKSKAKKPKADGGESIPRAKGATAETILKFIDDAGTATKEELLAETGLSAQGLYQQLVKLRKSGQIEVLANGEYGFTPTEQEKRRGLES